MCSRTVQTPIIKSILTVGTESGMQLQLQNSLNGVHTQTHTSSETNANDTFEQNHLIISCPLSCGLNILTTFIPKAATFPNLVPTV
jgi:hypothetical protein